MRIPARIKIGLLALGAAAFLAVLLLVVFPTAVANSPGARRLLERRLEAETQARVSFDTLRVRLIPRPCATLGELRLSRPQGPTLEAPQLEFCLDLFALLRGRIALAAIALEAPLIRAALPAGGGPSPGWPEVSAFPRLAEGIARSLPAARIVLRGGRLLLEESGGRVFLFRDLAFTLQRGGEELSWSATGAAEGIGSFSFSGRSEGKAGPAKAQLLARDVQPARLQETFLPGGPLRIAAGAIETLQAEAVFRDAGASSITLAVEGADLLLEAAGRSTPLAIERLEAQIEQEGPRRLLSVPALSFRNPKAALTLEAVVDERLTPRIQVAIAGRADVEGARAAALALLGGFEDVRLIFEVLRAGNAPEVEVRLAGDTWSDLDRLKTLWLRGRLEEGRIRLPWVDLDLEAVNGEARIERGILHGRALSARTLGATGTEGSLDVGLSAADPLLNLDIAVEAELSPLPGLLARLVRIPAFREQMALVRDFSGTAQGRLKLSGTHEDVAVSVSARELDLRGRYLPLPGPIALRGGSFDLEGRQLRIAGVEAELGDSRFRGLGFDCLAGDGGEIRLEAAAEEAEIDLAQAGAFFSRRFPAGGLAVERGRLSLRRVRFAGKPREAATWRLSAAGDLRGLSLEADFLPGPLKVDQAGIEFGGAGLAFRSPGIELSRSRVSSLEGAFRWAKDSGVDIQAARLQIDARDLLALIAAAATPAAAWLHPQEASGTLRVRDLDARIPLPGRQAEGPFLRASIEDAAIEGAFPGGRFALRAAEAVLAGESFSLAGESLSFGGATARDAVLAFDPERRFRLATPEARIEAVEFFPFLRLFPQVGREISEIENAGGVLRLSDVDIDLPLDGSGAARLAFEAAPEEFFLAGPFLGAPLRLAGGRLQAGMRDGPGGGVRLTLAGVEAGLGVNSARVDGTIESGGKELRLALDLALPVLDVARLAEDLEPLARRRGAGRPEPTGRIRLAVERALIDGIEIAPLRLSLEPGGGGGVAWIERGALCGMLFMGRVGFAGSAIDGYLVPVVDARPLEETVPCLTSEASFVSGNFNLDGALEAQGTIAELLRSAKGSFRFVAEDGTIRKSPFFARLFTVLNLTEIYRGSLPDFESRGFDYRRSTAELELAGGKLSVRDWTIDGPTLWMGGRGEIDLLRRNLDFTLMVSPFKTIDRIVNRIPGLGWILGGRLVAVPIKATGDLKDPKIVPLSPEAVGTSLLEMLKRTILLPVRIIQPLIPGMEEIESGTITR